MRAHTLFAVGMALAVPCACNRGPSSRPDASAASGSVDASNEAAEPDLGEAGGSSADAGPDADSPSPSETGADASADADDAGSSVSTASVLQFHHDSARDGVYVDDAMTLEAAKAIHRDPAFSATVAGQAYAQPLWVEQGPGGREAFLLATESNHVTAVGAGGAVLWDRAYGAAARTGLPCGNIAVGGASLGVTGTPVIDGASRTVYFDAMTRMTNVGGGVDRHLIHAVSLDDGAERPGWPVDVSAAVPGFDSPHQNQRGALTLMSGTLYVPFGGHFGDCLPYYGWVVGVDVAHPSSVKAWRTAGPPTWSTQPPVGGAGIWASGGLASDGSYLYAATGNSMNGGFIPPSTWVGGDAVLKLGPGPTFSGQAADYYYPSNWTTLDEGDVDLGGANPVLVDMPGAPYPRLVVALGKDGKMYLLDRDHLGGEGGALSITQVMDGELNGGAAAYTTAQGTYVAFRGFGVVRGCPNGGNLGDARILPGNPPTASVAWCSAASDLGSPIATTPDGKSSFVVWSAGARLYGFDGDTGALVFDGGKDAGDPMPDSMHYFNAAIDTKGRIVVATCGGCGRGPGNGRLFVFR